MPVPDLSDEIIQKIITFELAFHASFIYSGSFDMLGRTRQRQDHAEITENLVGKIPLMDAEYVEVSEAQDLPQQEWWTVFILQFLIWWSLWEIIDSIPDLIGFSNLSDLTWLRICLAETLLGAIIYLIPSPESWGHQLDKLKRFLGLVILCCGLWGSLDTLTDIIKSLSGIPNIFVYAVTFTVAVGLGTIHHYQFRENYLIDQLL